MNAPETDHGCRNPFYPALDLLLAKLLAAEQAVGVSEAAFEHASESQDEWLARIPEGQLPGMMADICDSSPGWVKYVPSLRLPNHETDYLVRAVRDFRTQSYLWSIARAFEHFREFVESIEAELPDGTCMSAGQGSEPIGDADQHKKSRLELALRRVRHIAPALVDCERTNARKIQLQQWIAVAEAVRNAVAHNEGILTEEAYERYSSSGLRKHFPGELEEGAGYVLKPTSETTAKTIRTFREYGVAIYRLVSEAQDLPARLVGQDGEITTWRR